MSKLSIITINRNNKEGLQLTMDSVFRQVYRDFEYIVIDGNSNDGSVDLIKKNENRITYWISEKDNGIYNAMNKGIVKANGEYLLFLNSGDYFYKDETLCDGIFESGSDIIISGILVDLKRIGSRKTYLPKKNITPTFFGRIGFIPHQSTFIKKELFSKFGLYDETYKMSGDYEFFMRSLLKEKCSYDIYPGIVSVYDDMGMSGDLQYRDKQNAEYHRMIAHNTQFMLSVYMRTILYIRNTFRIPLRSLAYKLNILTLIHKKTMKNLSQ